MRNNNIMKYKHVFSPLKVKNIIYDNRLCSTTMSTVPTHSHISSTNYGGIGILDKSLGGVAMIGMMYHGNGGTTMYEANGADPFGKYDMDVLRESLSVVKQGGALAGMAIGMGNVYKGELYTPSGLPFARPYSRESKPITETIMFELLDRTVEKAIKASKFGFDLLILDISNDNIAGHFMAPGFNKRTDQWGGSFENRFRLAKILVDKVREAIGHDFVLELRVSATLGVPETYPLEEMIQFIKSVENKIDILNVVTGMDEYHDGNIKLCPPIFEKHLLNYETAKRIKKECNVILNLSGSIMNIEEAEKVLCDNVADLVLLGRSIVADPYMPKKVLEGKREDVVPCIRCNNCYHIATEHFNTCCTVNPRIYRENRVPLKLEKTNSPKKVVVIGAGPSGIRTALTAAEKGHTVVLYEKNDCVGGKLVPATVGVLKEDLRNYFDYLKVQLNKSDVQVKLNCEATRQSIIDETPDVVVIAIGAEPTLPHIEGINNKNVKQAIDVLNENFNDLPETITILGAGSVGCELAIELSQKGKKITIVEFANDIAKNGNELYRTDLKINIEKIENIKIMLETGCMSVSEKEALLKDKEGNMFSLEHDLFIVATGLKRNMEDVYMYYGICPVTRYVGDCKNVASLTEANTEAYFIGASI